ncbi:hypothetical protein [Acaryochloris sp. IP29b_bin.137]|uniref:hypothetical protein n=1 Tax=Acaryochloris sp. IP29b_bin.137 TaxID=2969217 RepID=UPI002619F535|nr:hypothetical protein [Acaryochloris sp. IP29b_bin.137]
MKSTRNLTCPIEDLFVELSPKEAEQVVGGFRCASEHAKTVCDDGLRTKESVEGSLSCP